MIQVPLIYNNKIIISLFKGIFDKSTESVPVSHAVLKNDLLHTVNDMQMVR